MLETSCPDFYPLFFPFQQNSWLLSSIYESNVDGPVWSVGEGQLEVGAGPGVVEAEPLQGADGEHAQLQRSLEPAAHAHPRPVAEGEAGEGVCAVVAGVTAQPPLRPVRGGLGELGVRVGAEEGGVDHADPRGHAVAGQHQGGLRPPAHPGSHGLQTVALLCACAEILHPLQLLLGDDVLGAGADGVHDLPVQQLLLVRVGGQVVEEEGGGAARGVHPGHHRVHRHDGGDVSVVAAPHEHLLHHAQLPVPGTLLAAVPVKLVCCLVDVLAAQTEHICAGAVKPPALKTCYGSLNLDHDDIHLKYGSSMYL